MFCFCVVSGAVGALITELLLSVPCMHNDWTNFSCPFPQTNLEPFCRCLTPISIFSVEFFIFATLTMCSSFTECHSLLTSKRAFDQ